MKHPLAFLPTVIFGLLAIHTLFAPRALAFSPRTLVRIDGELPGDDMGFSVSSAGDVNGDGHTDVIVGARLNDAAGAGAGRAYVFHGGPGADMAADLTLTGEAAIDNFGHSVSGAGDVNGDGYEDVIVGALGAAGGTGRAYVFFGGPAADATADLTLTGEAAGDFFGGSVSGAGDVNGDGFADVIVGADLNGAGGLNAGRAYVYYGGAAPNAIPDLTLTGQAASDHFGTSVSGAGDVNGDGFADVIAGAEDAGSTGLAYVYYGGPGADATPDVTLSGESVADRFGSAVSGAGDVNGDGYADVIIGAPLNDAGGSGAGRAYVYYGGAQGNTTADLILTGEAAGDLFGSSVGDAGDVNADGYEDLIVGADSNDQGGNDAGRVYVFHGGPGADTVADAILTGEAAVDNFGRSVSGAGDWNADGVPDVIVGADGNDGGGVDAGRAYVATTRPYDVLSPDGGEQWVAGREERVRWLGGDLADLWISFDGGATYSVLVSGVGGGEVNSFAVTAPSPAGTNCKVRVSESGVPVTFANSDASRGVFSIVSPSTPPGAAARLRVAPTGAAASDFFGTTVSSAGDVNGDGYADLIVGAFGNDAGGASAGRAYVFHGGPGADATADLTLTGAAAIDQFGISVSGAGDVNGDGYDDVIVGANLNDVGGSNAGRAYVYYGGPSADATADLILTGAAASDFFGVSVSGAGDVNGDDFADVIVGANGNDAGGSGAGRAYVYYGGLAADATADLTLTGEAASDNFGISVSGAGDVNGDGFADVIVGADGNDAGGSAAGRAYVFHGGDGADAVADLTMTGEAIADNFGISVSEAGDVDGDGYGDVIVGANGSDAGGNGAGRAYVYFGGPAAALRTALTLTGEAANDNFGDAVSGAGDVNGDGFADVIVGANTNGAGGSLAGRAYVYYGGPGADETADLTLTGEAAGDSFGESVSGAGDVSGDGMADVIIGADGNDAGGSSAGRAYVYDFNRYHILSPVAGETWNVGALETVSWLGAKGARIWVSPDGGTSFSLLTPTPVGGAAQNAFALRVPHLPTRFARLRITPDDATSGFAQTDSFFTIQTSVALLSLLASPLPDGGASISWRSDPGLEDLAGYRLDRSTSSRPWTTVVPLLRENSYIDPAGGPGSRYRLFAVNGFGEELWLGETSIAPLKPLAAWPLPYRGGSLTISFAAAGGLGDGGSRTRVEIYDVHGRLVREIANASYPQGYHAASWDGNDGQGRPVASGVYFLRSMSGGEERTLRLAVLR